MRMFLGLIVMALVGLSLNVGAEPAGGRQIFDKWCVHCHAAGPANAGTVSLSRSRGADYAVLTDRTDLTAAYIKVVVRNGLKQMPSFRLLEISDEQLDSLASYLTQHP